MENAAIAVLVVEDEPLILMNAIDFFEEAGFKVYEARNAAEALRVLEEQDDIRVVFTDVDMPGSMNGLALAFAVWDRWPPIQLIVTSGFTRIPQSDLPAGGVFVPKPYQHNTITQLARQMVSLA
ncbi:response regulator [Aureimonas sp. AU4]|uniref:response regulator n=1 Tax=Aureimonas sp. AU4 TaxID=1638163 RepID=UPI000782B2EC|nr:response regulator [Aureimonas sp. AU4]